ncbi:hypothetical protein Bca4012_051075 [Brassica carinata]
MFCCHNLFCLILLFLISNGTITNQQSGRGSPSGRTGLWWQPPSGFDSLPMRKLPCLFWTPKRYWIRSSPDETIVRVSNASAFAMGSGDLI